MTDTALAQLDDEIIATNLIKLYTFRSEHPGTSIKAACEELGFNYQATTRWLREGKLAAHLANIHDPYSDLAQITALNELQSIVVYQARIARGEVQVRGGNPTAAAAFVLEVAKIGARQSEVSHGPSMQVSLFIPEIVRRQIEGNVIDAPSIVEL